MKVIIFISIADVWHIYTECHDRHKSVYARRAYRGSSDNVLVRAEVSLPRQAYASCVVLEEGQNGMYSTTHCTYDFFISFIYCSLFFIR